MTRAGRARRWGLAAVFTGVALVLAACSSDEPTAATTSTTTADHGADAAHTMGAMGIVPGTVSDVAALGDGPTVGDRWEIPVGVNICGRFIEVPTGGPVGGVTADVGGIALVEPTDGSPVGHDVTVGSYAEAAGLTVGTGELVLPPGVTPTEMTVGESELTLAGTTFRAGDDCGGTPAEVQAWVYSAEARRTGEDILVVVDDLDRIPFVEDGMAVVIALTPESSLPTLPPSAILGG